MNDFLFQLERATGAPRLHGRTLETLQVNLGPRCTLACRHCHLAASPRRTESMPDPVMDRILERLARTRCRRVDITGGAPELHPRFLDFIGRLHALGIALQVRTNLAIHAEPDMEPVARALLAHRVTLVGSLPCYLEENVDAQRGAGTFERSLVAIRRLNGLGYGLHPDRPLILVYNPAGPDLPPEQSRLESVYRQRLTELHGIAFTRLITITNMPIGRFRADLKRRGEEQRYLTTLRNAFNPATLDGLMCRHQISVGWDGRLFDCDFNLALELPVATTEPTIDTLSDALATRPIVTGDHCLACTAGAGSSCSGALAA